MADPSKKSAKSDIDVEEEAKRKKAILDQVAQSNLPTKTILKELGISRSTYYSWLKRFEEAGMEGLMDSRSAPKPPEPAETVEEKEVAQPTVERKPDEVMERTPDAAAEVAEAPLFSSATAQPETEVERRTAEPPKSEAMRSEETRMTEDTGGGERRGMGVYALIAVFLLAVGLLFTISSSNYKTYRFKKSGETLTLWKGKFAPKGLQIVESFDPMVVGEKDVSTLTGRTFSGKDGAFKALFGFLMNQVDQELAKDERANIGKVSGLLDQSEMLVGNPGENSNMAGPRLRLAQKRVALAETTLKKAYQKAVPVYEEALKAGLGDREILKEQLQTMQTALSVVAPKALPKGSTKIKAAPQPVQKEAVSKQPEAQPESAKKETAPAAKP